MKLIRSYNRPSTTTGRVVIFGHANPNSLHKPFFHPIKTFIRDELKDTIPILYLNGDQHKWKYEPNFYGRPAFLRITVTGLAVDPLLKVTVTADGQFVDPQLAYAIDRRL